MARGAGGFRDYSSEAMILNIPVKNLLLFIFINFNLFLKTRNVRDNLERFTKKDDIAKLHHSCHLLLLKEDGFCMRVLFK